jgi:magnesium transporter
MIRAWRYRQGVAGRTEIANDEIASSRAGPGTLLVVDSESPTEAELSALDQAFPLQAGMLDDLRRTNERTKLDRYPAHFRVAVHPVEVTDRRVVVKEVELLFAEDWLLIVRQPTPEGDPPFDLSEPIRRFEMARDEPDADDLGGMLWAVFDVIVDGYFGIGEHVDERLDEIEDLVFSDRISNETPREVFALRRGLVRFRRGAAPLREVLNELTRHDVEWLGPNTIVRLQDVYDHALRVADLTDSQRDLLTGLLEAHLAVVSNRMNDVMKKTSSWGALILVPSLIAGIYGMNFHNMLLQETSWGYPVVAIGTVVLTIGLYRFFRRLGWV